MSAGSGMHPTAAPARLGSAALVGLAVATAVALAGCGSSSSGGAPVSSSTPQPNVSTGSGSPSGATPAARITLTGTATGDQASGALVLLPASAVSAQQCGLSTVALKVKKHGKTPTKHRTDFTLSVPVRVGAEHFQLQVGVDGVPKHATHFSTGGKSVVRVELLGGSLPNGAAYTQYVSSLTLAADRKSGSFTSQMEFIKSATVKQGSTTSQTKQVGTGTLQGRFSCR